MKRIAAVGIVLFFAVNFIVLTNAEAYVSLELGLAQQVDNYNETNYGTTQWEFDDGANFALALGGTIKDAVRLEGELSYRKMDFKNRISIPSGTLQSGTGDQQQLQLMFNGIWQIMPEWRVSPFIGAGIGYSLIYWNDVAGGIDDGDAVLTWQLLAGASVRVAEKIFIEGTFYCVNPDDIELQDAYGDVGKLDNQRLRVFTLGVRFNF